MLRNEPELKIIGYVSDGLEAVRQAQQLQPDLILLDIGLPSLNGIEAARRIREVSPTSKILVVSDNRSPDIAREAFRAGASGYVVKSESGRELLPAMKTVLQGKQFITASLMGQDSSTPEDGHPAAMAIRHFHEAAFYGDEGSVVGGFARFIESTLKSGNVVVAIVTEAHRASLLRRLEAHDVSVSAAIEQGTYIPLDADDALSRLTVNYKPDPVRCAKVIDELIVGAAKGIQGQHAQVVCCGEMAPILLSRGSAEGAIQLEHLWDEITRSYGIRSLCGYLSSAFRDKETSPIFERICAEHSAVRRVGR
jgi:CheY-like chemotaxis protein